MKNFPRLLRLFVCLTTLRLGFPDFADAEVSGDWGYSILSEGRPPVSVITITNYSGPAGSVVVPSVIDDKPVRAIGDGFVTIDPQSRITSIVIPDSVRTINKAAFYGSTNLTAAALGNDVRTIGLAAFGLTKLDSIVIPASVTTFETHVFYKAKSLKNVVFEAGLTSIPETTFGDCSSLTNVEIPPEVAYIGVTAFANCVSLTNVAIPNGVTHIDGSAFGGCSGLKSVIIPDSVVSIGQMAFKECVSMTNLVLGSGLTEIAYGAFSYCDSLESVRLPSGLEAVAGGLLYQSAALVSAIVGANAVSVGDFAFGDCPSLTSVLFKGNAPVLSGRDKDVFGTATNTVVFVLSGATGWDTLFAGQSVQLFVPIVNSLAYHTNGTFEFSWLGTGQIPMDVERRNLMENDDAWSIVQSGVTNGAFLNETPQTGRAFYRASLP